MDVKNRVEALVQNREKLTPESAADSLRKACKRTFFKRRDIEDAEAVVVNATQDGLNTQSFINLGNENGKTALMFASQLSGSEDLVRFLLRLGADPNATTNRGHSAVMFATGEKDRLRFSHLNESCLGTYPHQTGHPF